MSEHITLPRSVVEQALEALETCDAALAEELAAWDIEPPLHHVLEASYSCVSSITALRAALAETEPEPMSALNKAFDDGYYQADQEWRRRGEPMRAEAMAYKEAYFNLVKMVAESKAMEPGCPVFLATPPTRQPLTDDAQ